MLIVSNILSGVTFNFNFVAVCGFEPGSLYKGGVKSRRDKNKGRAPSRWELRWDLQERDQVSLLYKAI